VEKLVSKFAFQKQPAPLHFGGSLLDQVVVPTNDVLAQAAAMVGTYPKRHARMLAKVPKTTPQYPECHAQMLAEVPKTPPWHPKAYAQMLAKVPKMSPKWVL
jgi:hypothetical protein